MDGYIKCNNELYKCTNNTRNILQDGFIVKYYVIKKVKKIDTGIAPYVKIKPVKHIVHKNHMDELKTCKSKLFYEMISSKIHT